MYHLLEMMLDHELKTKKLPTELKPMTLGYKN